MKQKDLLKENLKNHFEPLKGLIDDHRFYIGLADFIKYVDETNETRQLILRLTNKDNPRNTKIKSIEQIDDPALFKAKKMDSIEDAWRRLWILYLAKHSEKRDSFFDKYSVDCTRIISNRAPAFSSMPNDKRDDYKLYGQRIYNYLMDNIDAEKNILNSSSNIDSLIIVKPNNEYGLPLLIVNCDYNNPKKMDVKKKNWKHIYQAITEKITSYDKSSFDYINSKNFLIQKKFKKPTQIFKKIGGENMMIVEEIIIDCISRKTLSTRQNKT